MMGRTSLKVYDLDGDRGNRQVPAGVAPATTYGRGRIAQGDTGQSRIVANFLSACSNAEECGSFNLMRPSL